ncbi:MAG: methyltransferase domain-containing protein [Bacteroidetes bacterium]|nr:methyltransferase domain-containing protein [Bacteroidota bacterium]
MGYFFYNLYLLLTRRKLFLLGFLLVLVGFIALAISRLKINEDYTSIFPRDKDSEKFSFMMKNSSASNKIIISFTSIDTANPSKTDSLIKFADEFYDSIRLKFAGHIREIKYKTEDEEMRSVYDFIYENLPLFLTESDYARIEQKLSDSAITVELKNNYQTLISPAGIVLRQYLMNDPFHFTPLAIEKLNRIKTGENFSFEKNRIFSRDKNNLYLFISVRDAGDTRAMNALTNGIEKEIGFISNQKIEVTYFGTPVISEANADRIKKDLMITLSLSILFLVFFLGYYFRNWLASLVLLIPVIAGGAMSLSLLYLIKGNISAISLGMGSVLLGIGIDFSLHLFNHYRDSRSVSELYNEISKPVIVGALTTASAFLCLRLIQSPGLQDFGLFAALSVLSTAIATLVFLPMIIVPSFKKDRKPTSDYLMKFLSSYPFHKNRYLNLFILALTIVFLFTSRSVTFNANLMDMNYMSDKLRKAESGINRNSSFASSQVFVVTRGSNLNEALTNNEKVTDSLSVLKEAGIIGEYFNVNDLIPSRAQQLGKMELWQSFWNTRKDDLLARVSRKGTETGFKPGSFGQFEEILNKDYKPLPPENFESIRRVFLQDYLIESKDQSAVITLIRTDRENKARIRECILDSENTFFFDRQEFSERMLSLIQSQFTQLLLYSSLLVFILQLLSFGRIELALVTFIPLVISWIWTLGIMGILKVPFNFFNLMISTFIFGLGDDYSIFMTEGHQQKLQYNRDNVSGFKHSIILSAFTTMVGIGVLIFAGHPALRSIALVTVIGMTSAVIVTFTIQPVLINLLTHYQGRKRSLPVNLLNHLFSIVSLIYFFIATLAGGLLIPVLKILPVQSKTQRYLLHCVIWFFSKSVTYFNFHVPKILINKPKDLFQKPVIVISNHQSSLDLVLLLMLHPKLVILANFRSWKNPFYGRIIRFAGFIRSDTGLEDAVDSIRQRIREGYSVIVFPEGTRSADCRIKRFHKGAFYLADKLNLEIQPIVIHGACQALNKKEFFLRRGKITLKFLDRINPKVGKFGFENLEQAKGVVTWMRSEFEEIRKNVENPDRMKTDLINRYIYRGPVLEWYLRIKLKLEKNYNLINEIVPRQGAITDIGCGYGFMPVMLALCSDRRKITGIDYDENKILTAQNCAEDIPNLEFIHADIGNQQLQASDVFMLMDVLHYMSEDKQTALLKRCFESLNPNGIIIIRDADADLKKRTTGTTITEFFSTRSGFNKKEEMLRFVSGQLIRKLATDHGFKVKVIDNTKFTSNLIYILRKVDLYDGKYDRFKNKI